MSTSYSNGAVISNELFHKKVYYNVCNNAISAQFDGCGALSYYTVLNEVSVFKFFFSLFSINNKAIDLSSKYFNLSSKFLFAIPQATLTVALVPLTLKKVFGLEKSSSKKPSQEVAKGGNK